MAKEITAKGIDVSAHQGKIDWSKAKKHVDFVIIRCGYGGNYTNQDDKQWKNNIEACEKYGIPYGVYLYSYATTVEKAKSEADHVIRLLKGHRPDMPVFYDMEENTIAIQGKAKILSFAKAFCEKITAAGYLYGTYANKNWFENYMTNVWYDKYPKWLAQYNSKVTYNGIYDIWQYSSRGNVSGISGYVDMNYSYTSYLKGDVDGDGDVDAADARKAIRASAKLEKLTDAQKNAADMNNDGNVTAADAQSILQKSAGEK